MKNMKERKQMKCLVLPGTFTSLHAVSNLQTPFFNIKERWEFGMIQHQVPLSTELLVYRGS